MASQIVSGLYKDQLPETQGICRSIAAKLLQEKQLEVTGAEVWFKAFQDLGGDERNLELVIQSLDEIHASQVAFDQFSVSLGQALLLAGQENGNEHSSAVAWSYEPPKQLTEEGRVGAERAYQYLTGTKSGSGHWNFILFLIGLCLFMLGFIAGMLFQSNVSGKEKKRIMNQELSTTITSASAYNQIKDVAGFVNSLGKSIAISGMFGCDTDEQGHILALECLARKIPPLQLAERYHLIKGKLSMKSESMLADWRAIGNSHQVIKRDHEGAAIRLIKQDGTASEYALSWEQCANEPFVYIGKEETIAKCLMPGGDRSGLKMKPKYMTPRSRAQMMWARLVSDSIRAEEPRIVCGHYTPHEIHDFVGKGDTDPLAGQEAVDVPFNIQQPGQVHQDVPGTVVQPSPVVVDQVAGTVSESQVNVLTDLAGKLNLGGDQLLTILAKRGVNVITALSADQADEIIAKLRQKLPATTSAANQDQATQANPGNVSQADFAMKTSGPITEELIRQVKDELTKYHQETGENLIPALQNMFRNRQMEKIGDLTFNEGRELLLAIQGKQMEAYFSKSLAEAEAPVAT